MASVVKECPVVWIQGATCSGCSVSVLNTAAPDVRQLLIDQAVPGTHLNLRFQATLMAGSGDPVIQVLADTAAEAAGGFLLVVEGSVVTGGGGVFCQVGERDGKGITFLEHVLELGAKAQAVIALGTCACYGGIFGGAPNPAGCRGTAEVLAENGIATPVINVPGCPPHPDWFTTTVLTVLLGGLPKPEALDDVGRLKSLFGQLIHENCPRRPYFDQGKFAAHFGDEGCLYELGCKGPQTYADCPIRHWNAGVNWCIDAGAPCIGCCEPEFPDAVAPMYEKITEKRLERFKVVTRADDNAAAS